ncbi:hypothetical protein AGABI2DRAFT_196091, partial [Agaricus bisporus var. bisporus H97]|uniref:hypothetical protein n=1 Tax=Agaricus bisporus var. bisporus (strain H97 / ATCC MYA-4626 / FGSC 10389) TaxID=936046 RepID=UPI00029F62FE
MTDAIESAVNYMASNEHPALPSLPTSSFSQHTPTHLQREAKRPRAKSDSEGILLETADKRKSDSTISHSTIRPGANGPRSSRPVSMAESFQSTHTIVPGNGASALGGVNKRLSAVDGDLGSLQEDDDSSFKSVDEAPLSMLPTRGDSLPTHPLKRRSMSLNIPSTPPLDHLTPSVSAADLKHPSYSICEGFYNQPPLSASRTTTTLPSPSSSTSWIGAAPLSDVNRQLPHVPTHNVSTFTYPNRRPAPNHPAAPPSFRQTAVSITSSFAPAAGLAKRAVERVRGALGHMGSNASQGGGGSESISSVSISSASGYSSSASISSTAPSAFPSEWGVLNPGRTPSKQGVAACSGSMH